jgi:hypothetical protein
MPNSISKEERSRNSKVIVSLKTDDGEVAFSYARKKPYKCDIRFVKMVFEDAFNRLEKMLTSKQKETKIK